MWGPNREGWDFKRHSLFKISILLWISLTYILFAWFVIPESTAPYRNRISAAFKFKLPEVKTVTPANQTKELEQRVTELTESTSSQSEQKPVEKFKSKTRAVFNSLLTFFLNILRIIIALTLFYCSAVWGMRILGWLDLNPTSNLVVISTALGLGILSSIVMSMGLLGLMSWEWFALLLIILFATSNPLVSSRQLMTHFNAWFIKNHPHSNRILIVIGILLSLGILNAFIPDPFYDVLQYHLALPLTYLVHGGIVPVHYNANSGFPQTMEMLYTLGLGLGGNDTVPLLIQLGVTTLIGLLIFNSTAKPNYRWIGALIWISCPLVLETARFSMTDMFLTLCVTIAYLEITKTDRDTFSKSILLSAIFCGLAVSTKYTGLLFSLLIFLVLLWEQRSLPAHHRIKSILVFSTIIIVIFFPWGLKNLIHFGNPLYPLMQKTFGFKYSTAANADYLSVARSGLAALRSLSNHLFYLTFKGHQYPSMNFIGPLWLAFLPWMASSQNRKNAHVLGFIASAYILSAVFSPDWGRYFLLPLLPILTLFIVKSLTAGNNVKMSRFLFRFLIVGICLNFSGWLPMIERLSYGRLALFGMSPEREEKIYSPGYFAAATWVNSHLPENSKLMFIGETRSHLFKRKVTAPSVDNSHPFVEDLKHSQISENFYAKCKKNKYTHLLINPGEIKRLRGYPLHQWPNSSVILFAEFWRNHVRLVYSNSGISIYEIVSHSNKNTPFPNSLRSLLKAI